MQNYTFESVSSHGAVTAGSPAAWLLSFGAANLTLLALLLILLPLLKSTPAALPPETQIEWLDAAVEPPATPAVTAAADPLQAPQPVTPDSANVPPPPEPTVEPAPPEEPPAAPEEHAPPLTARMDATPLAINEHETADETPPKNAPFAGIDDAQARSRQPDPDGRGPVPVQPNGVAGQVLALGTAGDAEAEKTGITLQETRQPGAPADTTGATGATVATPAAEPDPPSPAANTAGAPAGASETMPVPVVPAAVTATAPETGIGPPVNTPPAPEEAHRPPVTADPVGRGGIVAAGQGTDPTQPNATGATAANDEATPDAAALARELARLEALKKADQAKPAGAVGRQSTVEIVADPTAGDAAAVTKTPLWNLRLNAAAEGPDTIETFQDPVARYLKDFRRILEQSFYREAGLPRNYRFRDGEYADFTMTFHADGSIDAVALMANTKTEQFTAEMIAICKTAIVRSGPYKKFTDELKKERDEFKLIVRFYF